MLVKSCVVIAQSFITTPLYNVAMTKVQPRFYFELTRKSIARPWWGAIWGSFNSLAPWRFQFNIRKVIFKLTLVNGGWSISHEIALRWMPQDLTYDKSTLVQVMAWCRQATSHYLSQCWPRSLSPYGVTSPQWFMSIYKKIDSVIMHCTWAMPWDLKVGKFRSQIMSFIRLHHIDGLMQKHVTPVH